MTIVNYKEFFELAGINRELPNKNALMGKFADGATEAQLKCIRKFGIGTSGLKYKGQASIVIDIAIKRANAKLATPGQMRAMKKMRIQNIGTKTFAEAVQILSGYNYDD